jgi:hypothetical protein
MVEWEDLQHDNTHEGKNYRNRPTNKRHLPPETSTVLTALKGILEDLLGSDNCWYVACGAPGGTTEGMVIWTMAMKDHEEMRAKGDDTRGNPNEQKILLWCLLYWCLVY